MRWSLVPPWASSIFAASTTGLYNRSATLFWPLQPYRLFGCFLPPSVEPTPSGLGTPLRRLVPPLPRLQSGPALVGSKPARHNRATTDCSKPEPLPSSSQKLSKLTLQDVGAPLRRYAETDRYQLSGMFIGCLILHPNLKRRS
jgi:hypothetical protein